jgi:putative transposase
MGVQYRKRVRHFNIAGHAHELTFSCYQRLPLLSRDRSCLWLVHSMDQARRALDYALLCYVIMPEHVHLIVQPRKADYVISQFLKRVKQSVSRKARAWLLESNSHWLEKLTIHHPCKKPEFRFWQAGGGYDRNITDPKSLLVMMNYIHNNPVRRGLVDVAAAWRWSSAAWYENRSGGPLEIDPVEW